MTLLDYPQKIAAIVFTSGCNLRCSFCYNPTLVLPALIKKSQRLKEKEIFDFFKKRKKYLDGVVITGGEPTSQKDLVVFCQKIKKLGYLIKLDTNGSRPEVLQELIAQKLVDYLAMDIKGPLAKYEKICRVKVNPEAIKKSIELIKNSGLPYEFRSTLIKGAHSKADVIKMAELIAGAEKYFLQNFSLAPNLVGKQFLGRIFTPEEMAEFCQAAKKITRDCQTR